MVLHIQQCVLCITLGNFLASQTHHSGTVVLDLSAKVAEHTHTATTHQCSLDSASCLAP